MKTQLFFLFNFLFFSINTIQAQWQEVLSVDDNNFYNIYTTESDDVYVAAEQSQIYKSEDGGTNFSIADLQEFGFIQGMDFINPMVGFAGGGCYFPFEDCPAHTFYKTINGGESWTVLLGQIDDFGVFTQVEAITEQNIFLLSDYHGLRHTQDGGQTWDSIEIDSTLPNRNYLNLQFLNESTGFVSIRVYVSSAMYSNLLYKTSDGGATWDLVFETEDLSLVDFQFINPDRGFIVSTQGRIISTEDGGSTWTTTTFGTEAEEAKDLFFVDAVHAYISAYDATLQRGRVYQSSNGGESWTIDLELDSTFVDQLHFSDAENGYLIAGFRHIYRRSDANAVTETPDILNLNVFPNPTTNDFSLSHNLPSDQTYQLYIYDSTGRLLTQQVLRKGDHQISVVTYPIGLYLLEIRDEAHRLRGHGKVVKE